ncbi:hypothetical protein [Fusobacterium polymorphum]|uniref:DUF2829 domain-containing protein n=1 Tax=Fusobacterium nucleatum subsp. polymorphum TaxID=76857 RepID=A0A2C6BJF7_FUSNP|nr:hypothetical protein [Fusobacterium polymorphum]PHI05728.1 hypothetical protein CBG54_00945 [Fusobacterium polymorphum]
MTFKQAVEEIKKGNKVKHKSWDSLMVEGFYSNTVNLTDNRGWPYYFELDDFLKRFGKFKNGWVLVSIEEYIEFINNWR